MEGYHGIKVSQGVSTFYWPIGRLIDLFGRLNSMMIMRSHYAALNVINSLRACYQ